MEVYGIPMCEAHGEEAAVGAFAEIAHDLEQELQKPMSPHLERALHLGFRALPGYADTFDYRRADAALLAAFPLDRSRVTWRRSATSRILTAARAPSMSIRSTPSCMAGCSCTTTCASPSRRTLTG